MQHTHVILLPKNNYMQWFNAAQEYCQAFDVTATPNPVTAGRSQHATVVVSPKGYPAEGDILKYLRERFPDQELDVIRVEKPEDLQEVLAQRVADGEAIPVVVLEQQPRMNTAPSHTYTKLTEAVYAEEMEQTPVELPSDEESDGELSLAMAEDETGSSREVPDWLMSDAAEESSVLTAEGSWESDDAGDIPDWLTDEAVKDSAVPQEEETSWDSDEAMEEEGAAEDDGEIHVAMQGEDDDTTDVRFTSYFPKQLSLQDWQNFLVYIHLPKMTSLVREDSGAFFEERVNLIGEAMGKSTQAIRRGSYITVVPELEGCVFNPPKMRIIWLEDWHRLIFRVKVRDSYLAEGHDLSMPRVGKVSFYVGSVLVGENNVWAEYTDDIEGPITATMLEGSTAAYQSIFVSYSHKDTKIVKALSVAYKALGMEFLRDVESLRSGEEWNARLLQMIDEADIFQLYWSKNSSASKYVRQEYEHALELGRPNFIRPVYWEKPMPDVPDLLSQTHFAPLQI